MKKQKIINDPVYGFIAIPTERIFQLIAHPYFQRLRRIAQMGTASLVYPGATHTRFHHALGAMHLMQKVLKCLQHKGHSINEQEHEASLIAILLHDIGHGPFSHSLEKNLINDIQHENISVLVMQYLNQLFDGELSLAIDIFCNRYERKFFHQLVSSQLDMDRLDYLQRDCLYTGVEEGRVGAERIIQMLEVYQDQIVVQEKGIYSIENFLNARRSMYWQVYLHKTCVGTDQMLGQIIRRAKYLAIHNKIKSPYESLNFFLKRNITLSDFKKQIVLKSFTQIDDHDIWASIKQWTHHPDWVIAKLSRMFLNREVFRTEVFEEAPDAAYVSRIREKIQAYWHISSEDASYFCTGAALSNKAYMAGEENIFVKKKDREIIDITQASDLPDIKALTHIVVKFYLCYPKDIHQRKI